MAFRWVRGRAARAVASSTAGALLTLSFVTVAGQRGPPATPAEWENAGRSVSEADSIIAANLGPAPSNCSTGISDAGDDLVDGDTSCPGVNADPKLGALQDNGGPVSDDGAGRGAAPRSASCPRRTAPRRLTRAGSAVPRARAVTPAPMSSRCRRSADCLLRVPGQSTATVSASINPNASHADTSVTVALRNQRELRSDIPRTGHRPWRQPRGLQRKPQRAAARHHLSLRDHRHQCRRREHLQRRHVHHRQPTGQRHLPCGVAPRNGRAVGRPSAPSGRPARPWT